MELWQFANGLDQTPVQTTDHVRPVKSVGNSKTLIHDIENFTQLYEVFRVLSESIAARLRRLGRQGSVLSIYLRGNDLHDMVRQVKLSRPTNIAKEILVSAFRLATRHFYFDIPLRSVGIAVSGLVSDEIDQLSLFETEQDRPRQKALEAVIETIRERYGARSIGSASLLLDKELTDFDPLRMHTIHPVSFYK